MFLEQIKQQQQKWYMINLINSKSGRESTSLRPALNSISLVFFLDQYLSVRGRAQENNPHFIGNGPEEKYFSVCALFAFFDSALQFIKLRDLKRVSKGRKIDCSLLTWGRRFWIRHPLGHGGWPLDILSRKSSIFQDSTHSTFLV